MRTTSEHCAAVATARCRRRRHCAGFFCAWWYAHILETFFPLLSAVVAGIPLLLKAGIKILLPK
jgi:hypothetical protein